MGTGGAVVAPPREPVTRVITRFVQPGPRLISPPPGGGDVPAPIILPPDPQLPPIAVSWYMGTNSHSLYMGKKSHVNAFIAN